MPAGALVRKVVPQNTVREHTLHIRADEVQDRDALLAGLSRAGYVRAPLVEDPGSFAVRGSILNLWPASEPLPLRLEFDGDELRSIRPFDPVLQRSMGEPAPAAPAPAAPAPMPRPPERRELWLPPAREALASVEAVDRARTVVRGLCDRIDLPSSQARALIEDVASGRSFFGAEGYLPAYYDLEPLSSYLPGDAILLLDDPATITQTVRRELGRADEDRDHKPRVPHLPVEALFTTEQEAVQAMLRHPVIALHRAAVVGQEGGHDLTLFEAAPQNAPSFGAIDQGDLERSTQTSRKSGGAQRTLDPLVLRISAWLERGRTVIIAARTQTQADRLISLLHARDVTVQTADSSLFDDAAGRARGVFVRVGPLSQGVVAPAEGLVLVTEEEIFGRKSHRAEARTTPRKPQAFLEDLRALAVSDLVVHVDHGIGRYQGLLHKNIGGTTVDLLVVEYAGGDKLYLPVYRLNQVQKWAGGEGAAPKLDRLGGQTFAKTKARAAKQVRQMADELLRVYAERQALTVEPLSAADDEYRAFEATFPYEETPDQARAIDDMLRDVAAERPMDRLVCGDVGFGKTEVAIRAAFRMAEAGKQVAVLCPTTVLAQQHYLSFSARMQNYPLTVSVMSRFQSKADHAKTLAGLKAGSVDIVIGTHRLLSKDVHFRRLGLLVIDEEQRFGVAHKERIKQLKHSVHVLTLTATPIPRTLQMAVSGLREMSLIATAPADRRAVRTIVTRMDDVVVRDAVRREIERGGQVFYVYNRVDGIHEKALRLQSLVPEARVTVGHGQMSEHALEQAMFDFVQGNYDILVSTAIIESGLDIPRANTILVDRADYFGLSDLYQLRGRVGRSKERGYCYLIVPPASSMTDAARTRIEALEQHTDLGSGFQIAALDLELRGAGDLLGAEQSGTVAAVGFDLFCRMLEEAVHELRGEPVVHDIEPELSFDAEALLPEDYVADIGVRLSLYKRFASADGEQQVLDLAAEMEDRFGPPPMEARRFVHLMRIKTELRALRVLGCEATARSVTLHLRDDTPLDPERLSTMVTKRNSPYRLTPDMRITRRMSADPAIEDGLAAVDTVLAELAPCLRV